MIKAIIFDCFGVLATDGWLPFKDRHFGNSAKNMERATELNHMVDAGLMAYDDFLHEIATMAGVSEKEVDTHLRSVVPNEPLLKYAAEQLRPRFKIGMLSNVSGDWLDGMFTAEQRTLFDAFILSYDTGVIKPDPRAYEIATERLGVLADECIFIDDQERNVTAAQEQGMHGIVYRKNTAVETEINKLVDKHNSIAK